MNEEDRMRYKRGFGQRELSNGLITEKNNEDHDASTAFCDCVIVDVVLDVVAT